MTNQEESYLLKSSQPVIHRAPWVITGLNSNARGVPQGIIEDGALVVADGLILTVGKYKNIVKEFGQYHILEHEGRVFAPALINGHCHLELSYLDIANCIQEQRRYNGDPTAWIRDFLA